MAFEFKKIAKGEYEIRYADGYRGRVTKNAKWGWDAVLLDDNAEELYALNFDSLKLGKAYIERKASETTVTRTNLMSKEKFEQRIDTPYYCCPSSETYWSM